jgi:hypothetical protein
MLGAICGDILGSGYEDEEKKYEDPESIKLCTERDNFTDDTAMTLAVADWLLNDIDKYYYNDDMLKEALGKQFLKYAKIHSFCPFCAILGKEHYNTYQLVLIARDGRTGRNFGNLIDRSGHQ